MVHDFHPPVPRGRANHERSMPHPQPGMAAFGQIRRGAAKAEDQEVPQPFLRAFKVIGRVHGAQNWIPGNLPVKGGHQTAEPILPYVCVDFVIR